jgi:hypothetical protein
MNRDIGHANDTARDTKIKLKIPEHQADFFAAFAFAHLALCAAAIFLSALFRKWPLSTNGNVLGF